MVNKELNNDDIRINFENELGEKFWVSHSDTTVFFTMEDYHEDNEFIITPEDKLFYTTLVFMFKDTLENTTNKLVWKSEAGELEENSHQLIFERLAEAFSIKFYNNPNSRYQFSGVCPVRFELRGGRDEELSKLFNLMLSFYKVMAERELGIEAPIKKRSKKGKKNR
jgi:hypothetical protein